jgi:Fur family transcriptional regulator, zinc uptake regulator
MAMKRPRALVANHEQVYRALQSARAPMTAYEILEALRPAGISAPPTIYRALSRLVEEGLAHRLESINSYVACVDPDHHQHHSVAFAICRDCGNIDELFESAALIRRLTQRASKRGFKVDTATVELRGHCASCADGALAT